VARSCEYGNELSGSSVTEIRRTDPADSAVRLSMLLSVGLRVLPRHSWQEILVRREWT
jgi:hypothetical protein